MLQKGDIGVLIHAEQKGSSFYIPATDRRILQDPTSEGRLLAEGMIDKERRLTKAGIELREKTLATLETMKKGMPFSTRKKANPKEILDAPRPWFTGKIKTHEYMTNLEYFAWGPSWSQLEPEQGSSALRHAMPSLLKTELSRETIQVVPFAWALLDIPVPELIWMRGEGTIVAIQGVYFDYTLYHFPSASWEVAVAHGGNRLVRAVVTHRGYIKNVAALIHEVKGAEHLIPKGMEEG